MSESILSIAKWHEETFPDATLEDQLEKYNEEQNEWFNCDYRDITELADMFIVACGITRFSLHEALYYLGSIGSWLNSIPFTAKEFISAVNEKMEKNRKRVWNKTGDGTYHHENGIED